MALTGDLGDLLHYRADSILGQHAISERAGEVGLGKGTGGGAPSGPIREPEKVERCQSVGNVQTL